MNLKNKQFITISEPELNGNEKKYVNQALDNGWISSKGDFILEFEKQFAEYCNQSYGIATSNGTTALHLALLALGIGEEDEVIVPDLTFVATANVVRYCGAKPVFIDVHPDYWGMNPEKIEEKVTPRTKAIIPVHLYGHPCDMDPIIALAKKHNLKIIEDCAEAHGALYKDKKVGSFGDISCFSFYGNKILTTGEGGMCVTGDKEYADKMKIVRDHGMNPKKQYWYDQIGYNYRMTNIQAAIGLAQFEQIEDFLKRRKQIASYYTKGMKKLEELGKISLYPNMDWAEPVCWMYSFVIQEKASISRDDLRHELRDYNIDSRPFFHPMHHLPMYKEQCTYPTSESLSKQGINIPTSVSLTQGDQDFIIEHINSIL